jgi:pimeloyl-ACP methyl ester carboxylesterase
MSRSGTISSNGQTLYYEVHGDGEPLVLVMGIGYDSSLWKLQQVPALSKRFRVVIFDNRDSGRSSRASRQYSIGDMADDVAGLLDGLQVPRAHVLGLSMGGMIGQEFALRHPDRIDRLVLSGVGGAAARNAFDPIRIWAWVKSHDGSGETFAAQQFVWLFSSRFLRDHAAVEQTLALLASNPNPVTPDAYGRQATAYLQHDVVDRLSRIQAPTLVVGGEQDLLTPPWIVEEVASAIPGAKFRMLRGAGTSHLLPLERPNEFNQLVTGFLSEPVTGSHTEAATTTDFAPPNVSASV